MAASKKKNLGLIHIVCIAWHGFSYPEKSLFLVWLFFHFAAGIMKLKAPTCSDMSRRKMSITMKDAFFFSLYEMVMKGPVDVRACAGRLV